MKQEFITHEDFEAQSEGEVSEHIIKDDEPYSDVATSCKELSGIAKSGNGFSHISVPREIKRQRVVNAFQDAFELIGGIARLAHWGDSHPTDFYKLYGRLLPAEAARKAVDVEERRVIHVLPKGQLDE